MLVSKADTAQQGRGGNSGAHVVGCLALKQLASVSATVGALHTTSLGFVGLAAFDFVLWAHLCHYCKSET